MESETISKTFKLFDFIGRLFSRRYKKAKLIEGVWDYSCILDKPFQFPEGGNAHGGVCTIKIERISILTTQIKVMGERTWFGNKDDNGIYEKKTLPTSRKWESHEGAFLSDTSIIYKYTIEEGSLEGISTLRLIYDDKSLKPSGKFNYLPNEGEAKDISGRILKTKPEFSNAFKIFGRVDFTRR